MQIEKRLIYFFYRFGHMLLKKNCKKRKKEMQISLITECHIGADEWATVMNEVHCQKQMSQWDESF